MTSSLPPGRAPAAIDCETAVRRLWDHLDGRLPMRAREEVEAHLDACALCPPHFAFAREMRAALGRAAPPLAADEDDPLRQRVRAALDRLWDSGELRCSHPAEADIPFPPPPDPPMAPPHVEMAEVLAVKRPGA